MLIRSDRFGDRSSQLKVLLVCRYIRTFFPSRLLLLLLLRVEWLGVSLPQDKIPLSGWPVLRCSPHHLARGDPKGKKEHGDIRV